MLTTVLQQLDPRMALHRGYALVFDKDGGVLRSVPQVGDELRIETEKFIVKTGVNHVEQKHS